MNLYKILGIDKSASQQDIRRAYKKMASKNHPDKGGDKDKFHEVNKAYKVLHDLCMRAKFDATGFIDEDKVDPKLAAIEGLMGLISQLLDNNIMYDNIINQAIEVVKEKKRGQIQNIASMQGNIKKLRKYNKSIFRKSDDQNFITTLIGEKISSIEINIDETDFKIIVDNELLKLLEDYDVRDPGVLDMFREQFLRIGQ